MQVNPSGTHPNLTVLELCAGGGGQTLGLEWAGFECIAAVEIERDACDTLRLNRPALRVVHSDIRNVNGRDFAGVDLVSAGVPCPPFSIAGKQLGAEDERDLFPEALRIIREAHPNAVMLENVPGFASSKFTGYRKCLVQALKKLGYEVGWRVLQASEFGVCQLRPRFFLVGLKPNKAAGFRWPTKKVASTTVGLELADLMASRGWPGALRWAERANSIAPTIVGGSHKHGGPDLGPTRARAAWRLLGVDGLGIANEPPGPEFPSEGLPRLTTRMVARLQSFPDSWAFSGNKTRGYRQVGNALPPRVAQALATSIANALHERPLEYNPNDELISAELISEVGA
jgi:DNA (cytosine-5)-methyltransferase 1